LSFNLGKDTDLQLQEVQDRLVGLLYLRIRYLNQSYPEYFADSDY